MKKVDYETLGKDLGRLVAEKQTAYGDSFGKSHKILQVLYPEGVNPDQYVDLLTICRVIDKLFRLASDPTYGDESPWLDICGYGLLGAGKAQKAKDADDSPKSPNPYGPGGTGRLDEV